MEETRKTNPLIAIAAISVTLFSIVGIGVMTGLIPGPSSKNSESALVTDAPKPATVEAKPVVTDDLKAKTETPSAPKQKTTAKHPAETTAKTTTSAATSQQAVPESSAKAPEAAKPAPVCTTCGVVTSVNATKQQGEGSGLGAVAGGVVGGLLGNQIGGGTGKKIATVAGAAGGAFAGHQVEKNMKSTTHYDVTVKMDDGAVRTFPFDAQPPFQTGSRVRIVNGTLTAD